MSWSNYFIHCIVAFSIVFLGDINPAFTLIGVPYSIWVVLKRDFSFVPILVLLFSASGYHIYAIFFTYLFISIRNLKNGGFKNDRKFILWAMVPVIIIIPLIIWQYIEKGQLTNVGVIEPLLIILCLFAYIYGKGLWLTISDRAITQFFLSGLIILLLQFRLLSGESQYIRLFFFFGPVSMPLFIIGLLKRKTIYLMIGLVGLILFYYFMSETFETFTLLGLTVFTTILLLLYILKGSLKISRKIVFYVFIAMFLGTAVVIVERNKFSIKAAHRGIISYSDLEIKDYDSFIKKLQMKTFDDRAVLWYGAIQDIIKAPFIIPKIDYTMVIEDNKRDIISVDYGAHNLFLETIHRFRWVAGSIIVILFINSIISAGFTISIKNLPAGLLPILMLVLITGIYGTSTGTFPLIPRFGGIFMLLAGLFAGLAEDSVIVESDDYNEILNRIQNNDYNE